MARIALDASVHKRVAVRQTATNRLRRMVDPDERMLRMERVNGSKTPGARVCLNNGQSRNVHTMARFKLTPVGTVDAFETVADNAPVAKIADSVVNEMGWIADSLVTV
jgi:hypothetical protein